MIINAVHSGWSIASLCIFVIAYVFVVTEEFTSLRKSKPVLLAAGLIWIMVGILAKQHALTTEAMLYVKHDLQEYVELLLFLLVAMTYVNVMHERKVFESLRCWLTRRNFNYRELFWATGVLAFFLSPFVDNLTTALIMCSVVLAAGKNNTKFISLACINIVVAANAGGVYSPFGDITSLMVWQYGALNFMDFFSIFIPALVSFLVPATIMSYYIPNEKPLSTHNDVKARYGSNIIIILFVLTILTAVGFKLFLGLPPVLGMMTGLGYLNLYGYYLRMKQHNLNVIQELEMAEWDTLLFFYGIMLCVGGLSAVGYLHYLSEFLYNSINLGLTPAFQATPANVLLGLTSALVDNIPVMYAVLTMEPLMSKGQWLLITFTVGVGGSMLSIGSAAGVALMGQAKEHYTFMSHIRWMPVIFLGFVAGIVTHLWLNYALF